MKEPPDGEVPRLKFGRVPNAGASVPVEFGAWHVKAFPITKLDAL